MREEVNVEFTISGLSKDTFSALMGWVWDLVEPAFPIITGAWGLAQTLYFASAIAGVALAARLIRYLSEGGGSNEPVPDGLGVKAARIHKHSPEPAQRAMNFAQLQGTITAAPDTAGASNEVSKAAAVALIFFRRLLVFISRMGLNYLLLSVLVCIFFGAGDLQILDVVFGIGG